MNALITGISGQDGSYLAELLLSKGYNVHGIIRKVNNHPNIDHIKDQLHLHYGDMTDTTSIRSAVQESRPDEIYYLAAMNQVKWSYEVPDLTMDINCGGLFRVIESVRSLNLNSKIYFAGSSEMYGKVIETPQTETTPFYPRSPYGVSKVAGYHMAKVFRESHNLKTYTGILFNHESPRRSEEFLTRKVCKYIASVLNGNKEKLRLGNLNAKRDFGYAKEYVEWIYNIVQHPTPDDFVISTGTMYSVREVLEIAFKYVNIQDWNAYIVHDESLLRPAEVDLLVGDSTKSKNLLGFSPKVKFPELIQIMIEHELNQYKK